MPVKSEFTPSPVPTWHVTTKHVDIMVTAGPQGLRLQSLTCVQTGKTWQGVEGHVLPHLTFAAAEGSAPAAPEWQMRHWHYQPDSRALRLDVEFELVVDGNSLLVEESLWLAYDLPVVRHWLTLRNHGAQAVEVLRCHVLDVALAHEVAGAPLALFYVDMLGGHWRDRWEPGDYNFGCHERPLGPGDSVRLQMGAYQEQCSWLAVRRPDGAGLAFGLEYDGAVELRAFDISRVAGGRIWASQSELHAGVRFVAVPPDPIHVSISPDAQWRSPISFWALFDGSWDHAAHVTHDVVEHHLAPPWPDEQFPYATFNTWGYAFDLSPEQVWRCVDVAGEIGAEVFEADYGWMRSLGDWVSVERNFPPLAELSKRVHDRGMKFGLWMSFANADPASPVAREHADWLAYPNDWGSFRSKALCLAHPAARDWAAEQASRVVSEYGVDHLKHDFELIKPCTHPEHGHPPDPSGYHSTQGYHEVLRRLRRAHPNLIIENCEGGGRIMSYDMVKLHDTSIVSDGPPLADALARRSGLYGATYPFPLRYCDNYMEERPTDYGCHSSMIGGPWIVMGRASDWTKKEVECVKRNIALYKQIRPLFRGGRVYHLRMADGADWDAFQVQHPDSGQGVLFVFQPPLARGDGVLVKLAGLDPARSYYLRSSTSHDGWRMDGATLMMQGLQRKLAPGTSDVVTIKAGK